MASIGFHVTPGVSTIATMRFFAGRMASLGLAGGFGNPLRRTTRRAKSDKDIIALGGAIAARFGRTFPLRRRLLLFGH
jgi:hypothetical protein